MKLQKITQKRWFWPLVCAVSVVFGWWYLSIVTCAPLGGDDELINLQNYYYITHTSFGQSVLDYLGDLWEQFSLQNGRFRPFSSPPVRGLTSWFLGDLVGYRLYILAWTYADIVLTAWLVGKASRNKKLGIACLCLLPMMFSVWQDSTGNSLYSYGALVQSTLLPALVAGLAVLRWQDTGHKRWAVLAGYCMFQCCATFEIGFTYIVPIFGLAWLYTDKARDALRLSIPALLGECVTLAFNMGARLMNTLRAAGILAGSVSQIEGISPNFDLPAILRTWAMQMSAGFPLNAMLFGKMRPGKIYPVDVLCGVMVAGAAVAALAALDKLPNKKQNLLLFLSGLAMLSAPALLIGLSPKYQQPGQVDWRHGYIPQTVESFGVGLMALAVLVMLLRWARGKSWWPGGRAVLYGLLAVCMAGSVVWQRAATRSAYDQGGRAYTVFGDGVAAGLAADCGDTPVVTDYMIWGGHEVAENAFFLRYGDLDADAHALQVWRTEDHADDEAVYRVGFTLGQDRHYDIAWCGLGHGADPDVLTDVEVWLPAGTFLYDVLYYTTADGEEVRREVYPDKNGSMITLDGEILADSIRLAFKVGGGVPDAPQPPCPLAEVQSLLDCHPVGAGYARPAALPQKPVHLSAAGRSYAAPAYSIHSRRCRPWHKINPAACCGRSALRRWRHLLRPWSGCTTSSFAPPAAAATPIPPTLVCTWPSRSAAWSTPPCRCSSARRMHWPGASALPCCWRRSIWPPSPCSPTACALPCPMSRARRGCCSVWWSTLPRRSGCPAAATGTRALSAARFITTQRILCSRPLHCWRCWPFTVSGRRCAMTWICVPTRSTRCC